MSIAFSCDQCGKRYAVKEALGGKAVKCKECGKVLRIPAAAPPPPAPPSLDVFGFDDAPARPSPSTASGLVEDAPLPPRPGAPPKPKTKEQKKAFEKRVKDKDRQKSSFAQPAFGISFGAAFVVTLFAFRMYNRVVRPLRAIARASAAGQEDPGRPPRPARKIGPITSPSFPDAGPGAVIEPGVRLHEVKLGPPSPTPEMPGHRGKLWLYVPEGTHGNKSLPCILIAGAGSNLITGMNLADSDRKEHLPYVRAGFAVLAYELDGAMSEDDDYIEEASEAFLAAQAGLVNARNALDYLALQVPEVDPARVYAVGHSSAGTMALLVAENEPRIRGCVAFAPAVDTARRIPPDAQSELAAVVPGAGDFFSRYNPKMHEDAIACPVFLFHAQDDSNVPVSESLECKTRLEQLGKSVTLEVVPTGNHYDGMIAQGIPRAIAWLKSQAGIP